MPSTKDFLLAATAKELGAALLLTMDSHAIAKLEASAVQDGSHPNAWMLGLVWDSQLRDEASALLDQLLRVEEEKQALLQTASEPPAHAEPNLNRI